MVYNFSTTFIPFFSNPLIWKDSECLELQSTLCDERMSKGWFSFCEILPWHCSETQPSKQTPEFLFVFVWFSHHDREALWKYRGNIKFSKFHCNIIVLGHSKQGQITVSERLKSCKIVATKSTLGQMDTVPMWLLLHASSVLHILGAKSVSGSCVKMKALDSKFLFPVVVDKCFEERQQSLSYKNQIWCMVIFYLDIPYKLIFNI